MKRQHQTVVAEVGARERIMAAATALFAERGYASSSVREIVALAGVTKPVLYYYFDNKEGLFRAILDWAAEMQQEVLTSVFRRPGSALERLVYLYGRVYQSVTENRDLFTMIHNLIFGPPQGVPDYDLEAYHRRLVQAIKGIYLEGLEKGEVIDIEPEEVAFLVLSVLDFCLHLDQIHPETSDSGRPERLLRLAFQGIETKKVKAEERSIHEGLM